MISQFLSGPILETSSAWFEEKKECLFMCWFFSHTQTRSLGLPLCLQILFPGFREAVLSFVRSILWDRSPACLEAAAPFWSAALWLVALQADQSLLLGQLWLLVRMEGSRQWQNPCWEKHLRCVLLIFSLQDLLNETRNNTDVRNCFLLPGLFCVCYIFVCFWLFPMSQATITGITLNHF